MYHLNPSVKQAAFITDSEGGILRCLRAMGACKAAIEWAEANDGLSFEELYNKCEKVDWLVWLACQANVECEKLFLLQEIQTSNHDFQTKSVEELAYFGTALAEASMDKLMSEKLPSLFERLLKRHGVCGRERKSFLASLEKKPRCMWELARKFPLKRFDFIFLVPRFRKSS